MIRIRVASSEDAPAMARVIVDTWFATHTEQVAPEVLQQRRNEWGYTQSEEGWRRSIADAGGTNSLILVATDNEQIVGVGAAQAEAVDSVEMGTLYISATHQNQGIGRRLFEATTNHYRKFGTTVMLIPMLSSNEPARRFYEHLGGQQTGTRHHPDGEEVVYQWLLTDATPKLGNKNMA